jgi:4-aminobutyrate aminotransferase/(S)-3-amino-2-methylpropionate transaminase
MSKSRTLHNVLNKYMDTRTVAMFTDLSKSHGNVLYDVNGKRYIDMYNNIASTPLGYNHSKMLTKFNNHFQDIKPYLLHRSALGINPHQHWPDQVEKLMNNYCPTGLDYVYIASENGSDAIENAIKATYLHHTYHPTRREWQHHQSKLCEQSIQKSVMQNEYPGSNNKGVIMSFEGGFHGRTLGALSATRSKAVQKLHVPAFSNWVATPFPKIDYTKDMYDHDNIAEEQRCLKLVEKRFSEDCDGEKGKESENKNIIGIIIEPIQSEGGDNHASPHFFFKLRELCLKWGVTFICDEVQTGVCSTGTRWAFEDWGLSEGGLPPPDIVCFAKKMQISGYFTRREYMAPQKNQIQSTWMGDPYRIFLSNIIAEIIAEDKLQDNVNEMGELLMNELQNLQNQSNGIMTNLRGKGTYIAFDVSDNNDWVKQYLERGINIGPCGSNGIRLRPSLIINKSGIDEFIEVTRQIMVNMMG